MQGLFNELLIPLSPIHAENGMTHHWPSQAFGWGKREKQEMKALDFL